MPFSIAQEVPLTRSVQAVHSVKCSAGPTASHIIDICVGRRLWSDFRALKPCFESRLYISLRKSLHLLVRCGVISLPPCDPSNYPQMSFSKPAIYMMSFPSSFHFIIVLLLQLLRYSAVQNAHFVIIVRPQCPETLNGEM